MISTGKILQIHRFVARTLEQAPPIASPGVVQILDWAIMRVEQNQARDDAYPCIFARGAELFYLISSIRPFRRRLVRGRLVVKAPGPWPQRGVFGRSAGDDRAHKTRLPGAAAAGL